MASNSNALIPNPSDPTKPLLCISFPTCTKLTHANYRSWRFQILRLLQGYGLSAYVDGTTTPPPATVTPKPTADNAEPTPVPNPDYTTWFRQDQLILGAIVGTIDDSVTPILLDATTSRDAWKTLEITYANPSRGHILQLKDRLRNITHEDARAPHNLEEAIRRANLYTEAGADATFVEAPMSTDELKEVAAKTKGLRIANMIEGGKTPLHTPEEFKEIGFHLIAHSLTTVYATAHALVNIMKILKEKGTTRNDLDKMATFSEFSELINLESWYEMESNFKNSSSKDN